MGFLWCKDGEHKVKVAFQTRQGERWCPEHPECHLAEIPKRRKPMGRSARKGTPAYDRARRNFNTVVCSERCFFSDFNEAGDPRRPGHRCTYPLDGHHLVPKSFLFENFADLPEDEFLAIIFDPRIGAPLCSKAHHTVEIKVGEDPYIYWEELEDDCAEFCERIDEKYAEVPLPSGSKRQSMLERLKLESPTGVGG